MEPIGKAFLAESRYRFESCFIRLFHCLDQINENQVWWKPNERMNSIGILIKHLCGNLRQWTVIQMNNSEDFRNRDEEFKDEKKPSKKDLINLLEEVKEDFISAVDNFDPARLGEPKFIQGFNVTILAAMYHSLTHLEEHLGQIIFLTRLQLVDNYKIFSWQKHGH